MQRNLHLLRSFPITAEKWLRSARLYVMCTHFSGKFPGPKEKGSENLFWIVRISENYYSLNHMLRRNKRRKEKTTRINTGIGKDVKLWEFLWGFALWIRGTLADICMMKFLHFCFMITLCLINSTWTLPSDLKLLVPVCFPGRGRSRPCGITEISACYVLSLLGEILTGSSKFLVSTHADFPDVISPFAFALVLGSSFGFSWQMHLFMASNLFPIHNKLKYL